MLLDTSFGYYRDVLRGILRYVRVHKPWIMLASIHGRRYSNPLDKVPVEAAIVGPSDDPMIAQLISRKIPVVNLSATRADLPFVSVYPDNSAIGRLAGEYLAERGFRNFAYFGLGRAAFSPVRAAAFREVAERIGATYSHYAPPHLGADPHAEDLSGLDAWLQSLPKPVGILTADELRGWIALGHCVQGGMDVPEQVAVIAGGNDPLVCESADVPLSAVEHGADRVGYRACEVLQQLLNGAPPPTQPILIPPLGVVTRQSSDILAIDVPEVAAAVRFIRQHACELLTVDDVVAHASTRRRWLERQFRRIVGRSIYADILRQRIKTGKTLLTESDLKIAVIAERCGFPHLQHFGSAFRSLTGTTPAAFRRAARITATEPSGLSPRR